MSPHKKKNKGYSQDWIFFTGSDLSFPWQYIIGARFFYKYFPFQKMLSLAKIQFAFLWHYLREVSKAFMNENISSSELHKFYYSYICSFLLFHLLKKHCNLHPGGVSILSLRSLSLGGAGCHIWAALWRGLHGENLESPAGTREDGSLAKNHKWISLPQLSLRWL